MRVSQALTHGQWLQLKITSVPLPPATSAIDSWRPSTLRIFTSRCGALSPSCNAVAGAASAAVSARAVKTIRPVIGPPLEPPDTRGLLECGVNLLLELRIGALAIDGIAQRAAAVVDQRHRQRARPVRVERIDELHVAPLLQVGREVDSLLAQKGQRLLRVAGEVARDQDQSQAA